MLSSLWYTLPLAKIQTLQLDLIHQDPIDFVFQFLLPSLLPQFVL